MIQTQKDLEQWYDTTDPWNYENSLDDIKRRDILLAEIPNRTYDNVLDIGCGSGFVTRDLPGKHIFGVDLSAQAIKQAQKIGKRRNISKLGRPIKYSVADLFELQEHFPENFFDLIIMTGVLYPQYIGQSQTLVYHIIDSLLNKHGILVSVHINEWYKSQFPFLKLKEYMYKYLTFTHRLELYIKP